MLSLPRLYVGLDYHVDSIRVCVVDEHGEERINRSTANDAEAVAALIARFGDPEVAAIERRVAERATLPKNSTSRPAGA